MDSKLRAELIREGNTAFNSKDYKKAKELFIKTGYADGLVRLGDYYMYEKRLPLLAYGYYKKAGAAVKVEDIHRRMIGAICQWLGKDKLKPEFAAGLQPAGLKAPGITAIKAGEDGMVAVPVNPDFRKAAMKIAAGVK